MIKSIQKIRFSGQFKNSAFLVVMGILFPLLASSQTTTQWRGADRHGVYPDIELLDSWPAEGPDLIRAYENIGNGYGSPTIADDVLYITGEINSTAYLFAFDATGNLLWRSSFGNEWVVNYDGSRSAPTVVGDLVYVTSGLGNITCFETQTGHQRWSKELLHELQGSSPLYGFAEAPLVHGDLVFITPGGADTNVVALDRFSGDIKWVCQGNREIPGYNSPSLISLPERDIVVLFSAYSLLGIDCRTGKLLWVHEQDNVPVSRRKLGPGDTHSNSVWFEDGFIYYIAGDGNGAVKLKLSDDGSEIMQLWRNKAIDNYMAGFVIQDEHLFTCTYNGKDLKRLNTGSGEVEGTLKIGTGSLILADEKIYYYTLKGMMYLVDPENLEVISSFKIDKGTKEHFSHPVIHQGILYVRHGNILLAYDIKT